MPRKCQFDDCTKCPVYGIELKKPTHCKEHATDQMIDVINKRCQYTDCKKRPAFGTQRGKPTHCKEHATDQMIDVVSKRCQFDDCTKHPVYGIELKKPTHCKEHATDDMVDVRSKRCQYMDCTKRPTFGLQWKKPIHCKNHATDEMFDVKNKRCQYDGCTKQPAFGTQWCKPTHCKEHATDEMIDVTHKHCQFDGCTKCPVYGIELKKPTHCKEHATDQMIDVKNKRCSTCNSIRTNPKFKPNCARCHYYLHPDDPRLRNYKTREQAFMLPLKAKYPDMILDTIINGGCSRRRPDGLIECITHSVVIEIDEDQHIGYSPQCENRRTMEIFSDLGSRPVIFVRLNPDSYVRAGKRVKAVFHTSKSGEFKANKLEFSRRFSALCSAVQLAIDSEPTCEVSYNQLFFND